jgi:hypothetical protein
MTLDAFARFSPARSTSERSAAAVAVTDSPWRFTRSVESFTCAAMRSRLVTVHGSLSAHNASLSQIRQRLCSV